MELWAGIPGYEDFYEVSTNGEVRSLTRTVPYGKHKQTKYNGRLLKQFVSGSYLSVKLSVGGGRKTRYVHELVLLAFEGPRPNLACRVEIRHLDGNKLNNSLTNLDYGTVSENAADRKLHAKGLIAAKRNDRKGAV